MCIRDRVGTIEEGRIGEPDEPHMREPAGRAADACLGQLRQTDEQVALAPWIVGAPAGAVGLEPHARVEHVASRKVSIRTRGWWQLRRVALFAAQYPESAAREL